MLCNVCREGLEGIWDPSKTKRVCTVDEWKGSEEPEPKPQPDPAYVKITKQAAIEVTERPDAPERFVFGHHATLESFLQSIDQGCVFCNRFQRLDRDAEPNPKIARFGYYSVFRVARKPRSMMYMNVDNSSGGFHMVPHDFSDEQLNLDISPYTGDEATWRIIRGWIQECVEKHTVCNRGGTTGYIPSRLVELSKAASEPTFRVVGRQDVDSQSTYVTLSHCWGVETAEERLKLTHSTAELLFKEQPCSILPKTFREALEVAGRLNIRYVWIDSMCIFQDSTEDWRAESSAMQDVYGNAFMSLAALGAEDDKGGLFFSRDPEKVKPTVFNFGVDGPENPQPYRLTLEKGWAWRLSFNREPLTKRGWVVQERLLPRRVLLFGSKQVFWECHESVRCETHPKTVHCSTAPRDNEKEEEKKELTPTTPEHAWKDIIGASYRFDLKDAVSQLFVDWYSLLHLYSPCDLTVPSDKLVAISGIAKDMKRHLAALGCHDTKYLAGVWSHRLPQALVWNVRAAALRVKEYRAPSWSWAAIDGSINIHDWALSRKSDMEILASVVDAQTTPAKHGDETGEVLDGMIVLEGILLAANLKPYVKTELHVFFASTRDVADFRNHNDGTLLTSIPEEGGENFTQSDVIFDTMGDVSSAVLCLPIVKAESTFNEITTWHVAGVAITEAGDGKYRRVGYFGTKVKREGDIQSIFEKATRARVSII